MSKFLTKKNAFVLLAVVSGIFIIGGFVLAATCDSSDPNQICNPLGNVTLTDIIGKLIDFLLTIALIICPLMIVVGGFFFITSAGDPAKANKGRAIMIYAAIGLVIILISKGLVTAVQKAVGAI